MNSTTDSYPIFLVRIIFMHAVLKCTEDTFYTDLLLTEMNYDVLIYLQLDHGHAVWIFRYLYMVKVKV